ncbi:type I restriction endonuclease subunit R [Streptomyces armeniacus]|nr:type I restriction endonuclease [Streptomyces armeniacus]
MAPQTTEQDEAERPFAAQLESMRWTHVRGSELTEEDREPGHPLLTGRLAEAVRRINPATPRHAADGTPTPASSWLDESAVGEVVGRLRRLVEHTDGPTLEDANREATRLLLGGTTMRAPSGRDDPVHYIDWEPGSSRNDFLAVSQFQVRTPGGRTATLDLVLFVNGIPLAVVECKSPDLADPLGDAIRDLRAYAGRPLDTDERPGREHPCGVPAVFATAQLLVAADGTQAALGTISADEAHYAAWRSVTPDYEDDKALHREMRRAQQESLPGERHFLAAGQDINGQHRLIAITLNQPNLLNIVRHYICELPVKNDAGEVVKRVKAVCRHQQYRAVEKIVHGLRTRPSRLAPGAVEDDRGGVVWHTQGSGKSLTMAFLVRRLHMNRDPALNAFTVLVITDRKQLQDQLSEALQRSESPLQTAESQADVEGMLEYAGRPGGRMVVFAMIQKYLGRVPGLVLDETARDERSLADDFEQARQRIDAGEDPADVVDPVPAENPARRREFRWCSDSDKVLVLIDEAHRSHASVLHACLRDAVPNAARIGFTGTPILQGRKKLSSEIFGRTIDVYRMDEAEADGVVVPVRYEGRTGPAQVTEGEDLNTRFADLLAPLTAKQKEALRGRWNRPTGRDVAESVPMIRAKAVDMLIHYVKGPLRRGFKAQVAAVSREAAVLYRHALRDARAELMARVRSFDPDRLRGVDPRDYRAYPKDPFNDDLLLLKAWQFQRVLRRIDFVPVISAGVEQKSGRWREWTDPDCQAEHIARFLQPLPTPPPENPWATEHPEEERKGDPPPLGGTNPWSKSGLPPALAEEPPVAFLIVKSMLLTGFDAPVEQALYLDRPIRDAELLQAVARVNRPAPRKELGLVVDYYGVLKDLTVTLATYRDDPSPEVREGGMRDMATEVPGLEAAAAEVERFLGDREITGLHSRAGMVNAMLMLADEDDRAEFDRLLSEFMRSLDRVLPHEAALGHVADAQWWTLLQKRVRRLYRDAPDGDFSLRAYGREVREMIADHLSLPQITQEIVPVSINDPEFDAAVERLANVRLAAAEQQHGLRYHLEQHERRERPQLYEELSKELDRVLREFDGRWEEMKRELGALIVRARQQDEANPALAGLTPAERLMHAQLADRLAREGDGLALPDEQLRDLGVQVCAAVTARVTLASFRSQESHLTSLETEIFQAVRGGLRAAGIRTGTEVHRNIARSLAGHVQEHLPQYQRASGTTGGW